ncbi:MAG: nucleotide sugar dehydrogenase [Candidatus Dormibacteraceae bacterium]
MPSLGYKAAALDKFERRDAHVCIVGLGYVGLPLAIAVAQAGHTVTGIDLDQGVVDSINAGRSHSPDMRSDQLARLVAERRLTASVSFKAARDADVAIIAVPTPIDEYRVPDLRHVHAAVEELSRNVKRGALVVLESTTYPGTTEEILAQEFRKQGFILGQDLFVGYSPERIDPGNERWNLANTPKIVSALTQDCLDLTIAFYGSFVEQLVPVSSLRTAEITKLFENIFRCINIALVNEFAQICDGFDIDVWEVIRACSTKPYGFMPFYPGPGLGGHCVPVDPFYLAWKAREKNVSTEFIELAGRVNAAMPAYIAEKAASLLNSQRKSLNGARIALLGIAYKKNTADVRESPAIKLIELLIEKGAVVSYHDPHVRVIESGPKLESQPLDARYLSAQDCVIVTTDHDAIDWSLVLQFGSIVLDTRNVLGRLRPWIGTRDESPLGAAPEGRT